MEASPGPAQDEAVKSHATPFPRHFLSSAPWFPAGGAPTHLNAWVSK